MKARDLFGVLVRVFGLIAILFALWNLAFAVVMTIAILNGASHEAGAGDYNPRDAGVGDYYTFAVPALVVGVLLLRFARQIVRFGYPDNKDDADA